MTVCLCVPASEELLEKITVTKSTNLLEGASRYDNEIETFVIIIKLHPHAVLIGGRRRCVEFISKTVL